MIHHRPIRLVIVDDHKIFVEALRAALETHPTTFLVVGEAGDARSAYSVVRATPADVVLLDLILPGADGVSATRELRAINEQLRILILSGYAHPDQIASALAAGAAGFASKGQSAHEILDAIKLVASGGRYLPKGFEDARELLPQLSPRQREVFGLVIRGFSNVEIGRELCISAKTVETHRVHINRKLGAHSTADLVRHAARMGFYSEFAC
jgi:DNA-binding NarL/FixJ family response regulator